MYDDTQILMASEPLKDYIPYSWLSMTQVKSQYYMAVAHDHMASAILDHKGTAKLQILMRCLKLEQIYKF